MLKGVTSYLNSLKRVLNAVFYLLSSTTRILWNTAITSSLVNYFALLRLLSVSWIRGRGYLSFLVISFNAL
jgi:hypothetical protein